MVSIRSANTVLRPKRTTRFEDSATCKAPSSRRRSTLGTSSPRSEEALQLHAYLTTILPPHGALEDDSYTWRSNEEDAGSIYSASKTWNALRIRAERKDWRSLVWFKGSIPKHSFNMWVSNYDRLPTRMRLSSWGMDVPKHCCLCSNVEETRDHLLLSCDFSREV